MSAPVDCEPLVACEPDHAPEAVQAVASVVDQVRVALAPFAMVLGVALRLMVGAADVTEIVTDCVALPPVPLHCSTYVVLAVSAPVDCEPLVARVPDHAPEAVHEEALVVDQLNVELAPLSIVLGFAVKVTVGAAALTVTVVDWVALPPAPVQESV